MTHQDAVYNETTQSFVYLSGYRLETFIILRVLRIGRANAGNVCHKKGTKGIPVIEIFLFSK